MGEILHRLGERLGFGRVHPSPVFGGSLVPPGTYWLRRFANAPIAA